MSAGGSHRLFVAVDPPAAVAAELAGWARGQRERGGALRAVRAAGIHLTLAFLGERPAADVAPIAAAIAAGVGEWTLAGGPSAPVDLDLGPPVLLPPRSPRVLAVEVRDPDGRLLALHAALTAALRSAVGWTPREHHLRPHLTVGRLSARRGGLGALDATPPGRFAVTEAVLYRSFLEPEAARYEPLERFPLC